jgi:hypothetical protein
MKSNDPVQAKEFAAHNKQSLSTDQVCGCFYCLRIFRSNEIDWPDKTDDTAMCPHCGIDAVIGESSGIPITKQFLLSLIHISEPTRPY